MTTPVVVTYPCKNGELEDNGPLQAKTVKSPLVLQHSGASPCNSSRSAW